MVTVCEVRVGVDCERRIPATAFGDLNWALTEVEAEEVRTGSEEILTEIWTAKESAGKAAGVGLATAPRRIRTRALHPRPAPEISFRKSEIDRMEFATRGWWLDDHHISVSWSVRDLG